MKTSPTAQKEEKALKKEEKNNLTFPLRCVFLKLGENLLIFLSPLIKFSLFSGPVWEA